MSSWSARFDVLVQLSSGKTLTILDDARRYLVTIPDDKSNERLQTAIEALLIAAEGRGPIMHANAGVARFVYGPRLPLEPQPSKETNWGRDQKAVFATFKAWLRRQWVGTPAAPIEPHGLDHYLMSLSCWLRMNQASN